MALRLKTGKFKDDGGTEAKLVGTCGPIGSQRTGGEMGDTYEIPMGETCHVLDAELRTGRQGERVMKFDCGALRSKQYAFVSRTQVGFMMKSSLN